MNKVKSDFLLIHHFNRPKGLYKFLVASRIGEKSLCEKLFLNNQFYYETIISFCFAFKLF